MWGCLVCDLDLMEALQRFRWPCMPRERGGLGVYKVAEDIGIGFWSEFLYICQLTLFILKITPSLIGLFLASVPVSSTPLSSR